MQRSRPIGVASIRVRPFDGERDDGFEITGARSDVQRRSTDGIGRVRLGFAGKQWATLTTATKPPSPAPTHRAAAPIPTSRRRS